MGKRHFHFLKHLFLKTFSRMIQAAGMITSKPEESLPSTVTQVERAEAKHQKIG